MAKTGQVHVDSFTITTPTREPVYSLGIMEPVGYVDDKPYMIDLKLLVWDDDFMSKLYDGMIDEGFLDSLFANKLKYRPCCAYCGTPVNVREQPIKCSSCGAPLGG